MLYSYIVMLGIMLKFIEVFAWRGMAWKWHESCF